MKKFNQQVGQLLIAGFESCELTAAERSWVKTIQPGGVILFRRNIADALQTYRLLVEASAFSEPPLLRCIDLEGGLVDRLRDVVGPMPSLAAVAATVDRVLYRRHGELIGGEAACFGFNVVLAPVLDLALPSSSTVMRTRTYFEEPRQVIALAGEFLAGMEVAGIVGCGKHFPGLGGGNLDSHRATPIIDRDWQTLWNKDILPYRRLKERLPMIMVSHAIYPAVDDARPASISASWIGSVLVKRMRYRGLIVSDDMEMGGVLTQVSIEEAAIQAVLAGTHLIEVCRDADLLHRAFEALLAETAKSVTFRRTIIRAVNRIRRFKASRLAPAMGMQPTPSLIEHLRLKVERFRKQVPEPLFEEMQ
jgi:beta-N-acetylhexosaminidase